MRSVVGIVMRTKNRGILLKRAVRSVVNQKYRNWQLAIVNDGGDQQDVEDIVAQIPSDLRKQVTVSHNKTSVGMEAASNIGITSINSDYLVIHDDDDSWEPSFLSKSVAFLEMESNLFYAGVVSNWNRCFENDRGEVYKVEKAGIPPRQMGLHYVCNVRTNFPPICFLYRRSIIDKIGLYNENLPVLGDWDFNLKFLQEGDIGVIQEDLANYHLRPDTNNPDLAGTVTHKNALHVAMFHKITGEYIRQELRDGRHGIGSIIGSYNQQIEQESSLAKALVLSGLYHLKLKMRLFLKPRVWKNIVSKRFVRLIATVRP